MDPHPPTPPGALRLGLGCSRLGSVGGASKDESLSLLPAALTEGFRVFDTSNIYGRETASGSSARPSAGTMTAS